MNIKFSVIIPAYNSSAFISDTLDSIKKQTYNNYEIIIVNDGSKDNTDEVIKDYIRNNPDVNIKYVWQENAGVSAARYRCGLEATGDYLAFLDADDIWYEKKLEMVAEEIKRSNADVIYHDFVEVSTKGKRHKTRTRTLDLNDPVSDLIINGNALATSATCVCMKLYRKIDPFSTKLSAYEDYECWIKFAVEGAIFSHLDEYLSEYKRNDSSLTLVNDKYILDSFNNQMTFLKYLDKSKYSEEQLEKIKNKLENDCNYVLGRSYHKQGRYSEAIKLYKSVLKNGRVTYKRIAVYLLALLRIKK